MLGNNVDLLVHTRPKMSILVKADIRNRSTTEVTLFFNILDLIRKAWNFF